MIGASERLESTQLCRFDGIKYFIQRHVESLPLLLTPKALFGNEKHEHPLKYSFRLSGEQRLRGGKGLSVLPGRQETMPDLCFWLRKVT